MESVKHNALFISAANFGVRHLLFEQIRRVYNYMKAQAMSTSCHNKRCFQARYWLKQKQQNFSFSVLILFEVQIMDHISLHLVYFCQQLKVPSGLYSGKSKQLHNLEKYKRFTLFRLKFHLHFYEWIWPNEWVLQWKIPTSNVTWTQFVYLYGKMLVCCDWFRHRTDRSISIATHRKLENWIWLYSWYSIWH